MTTFNLRALSDRMGPGRDGRFEPVAAAVLAVGFVGLSALAATAVPSVRDDRSVRRWYRGLDKPEATPPDPVFGVVWPLIEAALAFGGWRLLQAPSSGRRNLALGLLAFNLVQIPGYTALFFGAKSVAGGLASASAVVLGAWAYVATAWTVDRPAALAGLPLAGWTSFAEYLSVQIFRRNA